MLSALVCIARLAHLSLNFANSTELFEIVQLAGRLELALSRQNLRVHLQLFEPAYTIVVWLGADTFMNRPKTGRARATKALAQPAVERAAIVASRLTKLGVLDDLAPTIKWTGHLAKTASESLLNFALDY